MTNKSKMFCRAFFTVEAALVMPIVLGVILLMMYLMFFQYDRCLMEQDVGALTIKGCSIRAKDKDQLMVRLKIHAEEIPWNKYIAWYYTEPEMKLSGNKVSIQQRGTLKFPFGSLGISLGEERWNAEAALESERITPCSFLRLLRKGKEN